MANEFRIKKGLIVNETDLYVSGSEVGIGTTNPATTLTVAGNISGSGTLSIDGTATIDGTLTAAGGINGLTLTNGISGNNFNISGVNQVSISDPGEGIVFGGGSSGNITLAIVDDASDNILRLSGTGAELQVGTNRVLTTADEGSGNGLDADTVDGIQASSFLRSDTSDTATGNIRIENANNIPLRVTGSNASYTSIFVGNSGTGAATLWLDGSNGDLVGSDYAAVRQTNDKHLELLVSSAGGDIIFTESGDETMRLKDGNVGIGEPTPASLLHLSGSSNNAIITLENNGNGNISGIDFVRERSTGPGVNGGSLFLESNTSGTQSFLYLQAQTASADAGITSALTAGNGVRLVLKGGQGIFSVETGASETFKVDNGDVTLTGDLTVGGTVTAQEFHTEFVSASIIYQSGSTKFGDTSDDVHSFSGSIGLSNTPSDSIIASFDHTDFDSRQVGLPGRFMVGPLGNGYPQIGYNFTTSGGSYTKIANDEAWRITFGASNRMDFSFAATGTGTFSWNDYLSILETGEVGIGTTSPATTLDVDGDITANSFFGDTLNLNSISTNDEGTEYTWFDSNSSSSGTTWYKVADITLGAGSFSGVTLEVEYYYPNSNHGSSADIQRYFGSVRCTRSSGTDGDTDDAEVNFTDANRIRVVKTALGVYELQARANVNNRSYGVTYRILSSAGATITPASSKTAGSTSGTAYTGSPDDGLIYKFGGTVNVGSDLNVDGGTLFVDSTSNEVGIGTTSPGVKLDVVGTTSVGNVSDQTTRNNDGTFGLNVIQSGTDALRLVNSGDFKTDFVLNTGNNRLDIRDTDNSNLVVMSLMMNNTGNVGIGTNIPSQKLTVAGTISGSSDLSIDGNSIFDGTVGYNTFNSGFGGNGWRIDSNANAEFQNLTVRGTFSVYELLAQQIRATNGSLLVATSGKVDSVDGTTLYFDSGSGYGHGFVAGDVLISQRLDPVGGQLERTFITVDSVANTGSLVYTDASGSPSTPQPGQEFVRIGHTSNANRQGHIYLTADDTYAPYIGVRDGLSGSAQFEGGESIEKVRVGRLDGITSSTFGSLSGYGLWASGSVYLEGGINATSGKIADLNITSTKIYTGAGNFNNADTGFYVDNSSNFSLGSKFSWNGSALTVDGNITATAGNIGGFTISSDALSGTNFYLSGSATGNEFFISSSNFNVKANGDLTGSNVLLDGGQIVSFPDVDTLYDRNGNIAKIGDLDFDGALSYTDAKSILESTVLLRNLSAYEFFIADTAEDGDVDAADVVNILKVLDGQTTGTGSAGQPAVDSGNPYFTDVKLEINKSGSFLYGSGQPRSNSGGYDDREIFFEVGPMYSKFNQLYTSYLSSENFYADNAQFTTIDKAFQINTIRGVSTTEDSTFEVGLTGSLVISHGTTDQDANSSALVVGGPTVVNDDLTVDTDTLFVDASEDKVGIGTTQPDATLHISESGVSVSREFKFFGNPGEEGSAFRYVENSGASLSTSNFYIQDADNNNSRGTLRITGNNGNIESLFVASSGNVGIGTTSPSSKLHVEGNISGSGTLKIQGDAIIARGDTSGKQNYHDLYIGGTGLASTDSAIYIGNQGDGTGYGWELFYSGSGSGNENKLVFISENLGSPNNVMTMLQDGYIGIGTTSPEHKIHLGPNSGTVKLALEWSDGNSATSGEAYSTIYTSGQGASYPFSGRGNLILQPRNTDSNGFGDLVVMTGATASPKFVVQAEGNVGIGTDSPDTKLHIYKEAAAETLLTLHNYQSDINPNGSQGNFIDFKMTDGNATFTPQARIGMIVRDTDGDGGIISEGTGNFVVYTGQGTDASGNGTLTEHFRITDKGNVGIGTTSPSYALDIERTSGEVAIQLQARDDSSNSSLYFGDNSDADVGSLIYNHGSNYMAFTTNTSERMRIDSSGNVGIGTTDLSTNLGDDTEPRFVLDGRGYMIDTASGTNRYRLWGMMEPKPIRPSSITRAEAGGIGTNEDTTRFPNVYAESDLTAIDNDATFTYAAAIAAAETHGGRLPTLQEVMAGVGQGSGQGYDAEYIWTQTTAGHNKVWVCKGHFVTYNDAKIVDISDANEVYRVRAAFDVSKANMSVHYDDNSAIRTNVVKAQGSTSNLELYNGSGNGIMISGSNDNVGIGTSTPANALHVYDATSDAPLRIQSGDAYTGIQFQDSSATGNLFYRGDEDHAYFSANTSFGVGVQNPSYAFEIEGDQKINNGSLGVDVNPNTTVDGRIDAANDIVAYSSDRRLKEKIEFIADPLEKINSLSGFTYNWNELAGEITKFDRSKRHVGVFAQDVQVVLPEAVKPAPFDNDGNDNSISGENYLTVQYEKLVPLLIEGIKEQQKEINKLKEMVNKLLEKDA